MQRSIYQPHILGHWDWYCWSGAASAHWETTEITAGNQGLGRKEVVHTSGVAVTDRSTATQPPLSNHTTPLSDGFMIYWQWQKQLTITSGSTMRHSHVPNLVGNLPQGLKRCVAHGCKQPFGTRVHGCVGCIRHLGMQSLLWSEIAGVGRNVNTIIIHSIQESGPLWL